MKVPDLWMSYPDTYRAKEIQMIANWIASGESGSVLGVVGCGRSHLLSYLSHRSEVLNRYFPNTIDQVVLIPVDLYNLPTQDLSSLYRFILHEFYWARDKFKDEISQTIIQLYLENRNCLDPFLPQMALYELLYLLQSKQIRVVLILNRFHQFCETTTPAMINTLRALRDSFRGTLIYIVGMRNDISYLPNPESLGDLYDLLVGHVCWVGALTEQDAVEMLNRNFRNTRLTPTENQSAMILKLGGHFPSLLKAIMYWWVTNSHHLPPLEVWAEQLFQENGIQYRLRRVWDCLTQEEQLVLNKLYKHQRMQFSEGTFTSASTNEVFPQRQQDFVTLYLLEAKGMCHRVENSWQIYGELIARFVEKMAGNVRGGIWMDEKSRNIYQGQQVLEDFTPLEYEILHFLIKHPRIKHSRDQVIDNAWPDEDQREGITPNALQVHIRNIRRKIELDPANPRYLITWHGRPGGYQFFPEGKPL